MSLFDALIRVIFVIGSFVLCVAFFVIFIGIHNNMKGGNTFRLMLPLVLFERSQFSEVGNRYRVRFLILYAVSLGWGLLFYWYFMNA
jgi:hypothetical protein